MTGLVVFIHTVICVGLVGAILMQSGRGGGLTEAFASAESVFGAQTNDFLIKSTSILATLFFVTCLSLAVLSVKRDQSIMSTKVAAPKAMQEVSEEMQVEGQAAADKMETMIDSEVKPMVTEKAAEVQATLPEVPMAK